MTMSQWEGKERRQSVRVQLSVKVELVGEITPRFLYTRDVSLGGAFILCDEPMVVGTKLKITLALPGVRPLIPLLGVVVRQQLTGDKGVGVEFADVPDAFGLLLQEALQK